MHLPPYRKVHRRGEVNLLKFTRIVRVNLTKVNLNPLVHQTSHQRLTQNVHMNLRVNQETGP